MNRPEDYDVRALEPSRKGPAVVNAYNGTGTLLHAVASPATPVGTGRYRALCGSIVRNLTAVAWRPAGPGRRCASCIASAFRLEEPAIHG